MAALMHSSWIDTSLCLAGYWTVQLTVKCSWALVANCSMLINQQLRSREDSSSQHTYRNTITTLEVSFHKTMQQPICCEALAQNNHYLKKKTHTRLLIKFVIHLQRLHCETDFLIINSLIKREWRTVDTRTILTSDDERVEHWIPRTTVLLCAETQATRMTQLQCIMTKNIRSHFEQNHLSVNLCCSIHLVQYTTE